LPRIIAIVNQKGGVGKTTTAINLSACLADAGRKTLLIDLDPQGNATSGLGVVKGDQEYSSFDIFDSRPSLQTMILTTEIDNLHLIAANIDLVGVERGLKDDQEAPLHLRGYLEENGVYQNSNAFNHEYIIIDCPPSLGILTANALLAAKTILAPVQCEYFALEGLTELHRTYNHVRTHSNPELDLEGILLTMVDSRTNLSNQVEQEIRSYYKDDVFEVTIPRGVRISESPSFGMPIILYDPKGKGAQAYRSLCQEVLDHETKRTRTRDQRSDARETEDNTEEIQSQTSDQ
jgi:chromosome partitioning protein